MVLALGQPPPEASKRGYLEKGAFSKGKRVREPAHLSRTTSFFRSTGQDLSPSLQTHTCTNKRWHKRRPNGPQDDVFKIAPPPKFRDASDAPLRPLAFLGKHLFPRSNGAGVLRGFNQKRK